MSLYRNDKIKLTSQIMSIISLIIGSCFIGASLGFGVGFGVFLVGWGCFPIV